MTRIWSKSVRSKLLNQDYDHHPNRIGNVLGVSEAGSQIGGRLRPSTKFAVEDHLLVRTWLVMTELSLELISRKVQSLLQCWHWKCNGERERTTVRWGAVNGSGFWLWRESYMCDSEAMIWCIYDWHPIILLCIPQGSNGVYGHLTSSSGSTRHDDVVIQFWFWYSV